MTEPATTGSMSPQRLDAGRLEVEAAVRMDSWRNPE